MLKLISLWCCRLLGCVSYFFPILLGVGTGVLRVSPISIISVIVSTVVVIPSVVVPSSVTPVSLSVPSVVSPLIVPLVPITSLVGLSFSLLGGVLL